MANPFPCVQREEEKSKVFFKMGRKAAGALSN
jgi:hypothetical protein